MRKALNDNPVAQIAVLGVLVVIVGFLLMTRVVHKSGDSDSAATSTPPRPPPAPADTTGAPTSPSPAVGDDSSKHRLRPRWRRRPPRPPARRPAPQLGGFVAGPGLPAPVVKAYADDKAVVLFVFRHGGIDDSAVRASVERLRGRSDLAVFVTHAANIARYARITEGVDVNRVPALIVVRPRHLTHGTPTASVSYGFRGPDSVDQAIRNALYKGPSEPPVLPEVAYPLPNCVSLWRRSAWIARERSVD